MKDWFKKLRDINTTIALATLIVTSTGVFAGTKLLSNSQLITITDESEAADINQESTSGNNLNQNIKVDGKSKVKDIDQKQTK